eukprot:UC1_evm1s1536
MQEVFASKTAALQALEGEQSRSSALSQQLQAAAEAQALQHNHLSAREQGLQGAIESLRSERDAWQRECQHLRSALAAAIRVDSGAIGNHDANGLQQQQQQQEQEQELNTSTAAVAAEAMR